MAKQKLKTRKTLKKRIKITGQGKVIKADIDTGHLKRKWTANKRLRKKSSSVVTTKGYRKNFKKMLAKAGKKIK